MAKMVPSKLVKEIDALFPNLANMERIGWSHDHQIALAGVIALYESMSKDSLTDLSEDDQILLDRAVHAVGGVVETWKNSDINALKLFGQPTLEQQSNLGNRNALQLIRDVLQECPDEAPPERTPAGGGPRKVTAFISYSHTDREYGGQAKRVLAEVGIEAFLAHEDLNVSDEWRDRILDELQGCEILVPLLSKAFLASTWAPQEVGYIISRLPQVAIAPLSIDDTIPGGFISHVQSRRIPAGGITRELLVLPLAPRFPRTIIPGLIRIAGRAGDFRSAEAKMAPLVPLFPLFTPEEAEALAEASVENGQVWSAALCRTEYLPELIRIQGKNIAVETLRALRYQIDQDSWYRGNTSEG